MAPGSGTAIERRIDEAWFPAVVIDSYVEGESIMYDVEYDGDGNQELEVPGSEIRVFTGTPPVRANPRPPADPDTCVPVATLHGNDDGDASAFVVNGASTKLGAGGGLHCVRFRHPYA